MKDKINTADILSFSGAMIAFCIGSGFATGQEILQFFCSFGIEGSLGACVITTCLFVVCGSKIFEDGRIFKFKSAGSIYKYYCGNIVGGFFQYFTPVYLFMMFVMMISGSGATLHEYYNINISAGRYMMAILTIVTVLMGLNNLVNIIGHIGPVMILVCITIGIVTIVQNPHSLTSANAEMSLLTIPKSTSSWWMSGLLYVAYNIVGMTPFIANIGAKAKNSKDTRYSGAVAGLTLGITILTLNYGLLTHIGSVYNKAVPSLFIANNISNTVGLIFSLIIISGIYTTSVPLLWSVCNVFAADENSPKFKLTAVFLTLIGLVFSRLPFGRLVNTIYPYTGYLGMVLIIGILYKKLWLKQ